MKHRIARNKITAHAGIHLLARTMPMMIITKRRQPSVAPIIAGLEIARVSVGNSRQSVSSCVALVCTGISVESDKKHGQRKLELRDSSCIFQENNENKSPGTVTIKRHKRENT